MDLNATLDIEGTLINAEKIDQNLAGDTFAITYNDNGELHLYVFDEK